MSDLSAESRLTAEAIGAAKDYADAVLKSPLQELGGILSDTVGYWRLKNQVRLLLKAKKYLEEKNVDSSKILPDIFVPIVEDGSTVADEMLSDMFAALLASHIDPATQDSVHPSFSKVLAQLAPIDAKMISRFRQFVSDKQYRDLGLRGSPIRVDRAAEMLGVSRDVAYLSCLNLHRLGLARHFGFSPPKGHPFPDFFEDDRDHQDFQITEYGIAFCDACGCGSMWHARGRD